MKKKILYAMLTVAIVFSAHAEDRKSKREILQAVRHYQRLMESAHPSPDPKYFQSEQSKLPMINSNESELPLFLNVDLVDSELGETSKMQNESSVAVNPTNPLNLISSAVDYRSGSSTWVYVSNDGGKTWINHNLGKPFPDWRSSNDPSVYFASDGTGYLCYGGFGESLANAVGENAVFIAKTTDEGKTWKAHIPVILHKGTQTLDSLFEDKYYVQVDNSPSSDYFSHVYIPWKRVSPRDSATQIVLAKSIDKGETWSNPVNISYRLPGTSEDTTFGQSFPICTNGPNGEVYVAWNHGIEHGIGFVKSNDGGATFTEPRIIQRYNIFGTTTMLAGQGYRHTVKSKVRAEAYPTLICDNSQGPRSGYLYLTWSADKIPNVYFSRSTDNGETWSNPIIVLSDTTNDQFWQWMSIDPLNGDLAIMYFDSRNDPNNIMVECYASYSPDGGLTWTDKRAADQKSDLRLNPFTANSFAGDYSGSAFYDGIFYPTWVDMRNAKSNIQDSDVYSAIINTQAPNPIENLRIAIIPDEPTTLKITWENPNERAFGQQLNDDDYSILVLRDGTIYKNLSGGINSLDESELTTYNKYTYQFIVISGNDSSIARSAESYAGGSKAPATATVNSSSGSATNTVSLLVEIPNKRADGQTPFTNLKNIDIYRDGVFLKTQLLQISDTSKVIIIDDNPSEIGYYTYSIIVKDQFDNPSEASEPYIAYSGEILYKDLISENFDEIKLPKYYLSSNWEQTKELALSKDYSLSNAPYRDYEAGQGDTLLLFPINTNGEQFYLSFAHCGFIASNDYSTIEYSTDNRATWSNTFNGVETKWNRNSYPVWKDADLNELDWQIEEFQLPTSNDTIYVRFRFYANNLANNKGWYLDNIRISPTPISEYKETISESSVLVFPNPANEQINIRSTIPVLSQSMQFRIMDILGAVMIDGAINMDSNGNCHINTSMLNNGMYYLMLSDGNKLILRKEISIVR